MVGLDEMTVPDEKPHVQIARVVFVKTTSVFISIALSMWAFNHLFPAHAIPFTFPNFFAVMFLRAFVMGANKS